MKNKVRNIVKSILFYGFTLIGGIMCGALAVCGGFFYLSFKIPFLVKNLDHQSMITNVSIVDPNFGIKWPVVTWPWIYVLIATLIATVAWINYLWVYYKEE